MYQENRGTPFLISIRHKIQYLSDNCSLQWLGYVLSPFPTPLFKRLFWLVTIIACCASSAIVLQGALQLYTTDAVSYSVETDYLEWDTPFPALTICEHNTPKQSRIKKFLNHNNLSLDLIPFVIDVSFWNLKFCRSCASCEMGKTCAENFLELVNRVRIKCADLLTECWWDNKPFPCCERFHPITTEYGTCFVFNSRLISNDTTLILNRMTYMNGLPSLVFSATQDIFIRIHSPDDMITAASEDILARSQCSFLPRVSDFDVNLKAEQITSDISVQPLSVDSRDCLFRHERPVFAHHWSFTQYSYSACEMYCRAIVQAEVCNCTHHFMPQIGDIPKCDIDGLVCLYDTTRNKLSTEKYHCPMACEEVSYNVGHVTCSRTINNLPEELSRRGTRGRLRLWSLPTLRVRRHAIRELLGLVVDVGGVIGVFFGASLLSLIEIIYILFIRKYP